MDPGKKKRTKRMVRKLGTLITEGLIRGAAGAAIGMLIKWLLER